MPTGIIKWYNSNRGFGFILPDSGGKSIFADDQKISSRSIVKLKVGMRVSYEINKHHIDPQAENIYLEDGTP